LCPVSTDPADRADHRPEEGVRPDAPGPDITIAFGSDADVSALRQISSATRSYDYVVLDPDDIQSVLLKSVLRRS
jgi:hypothetical protein